MRAAPRAVGRVGPLSEGLAGALAYFTFIPAIIFLFRPPYRENRFVRYHSIQCLLLWLVLVIAAALLKLVSVVVIMIPVAGPLLMVIATAVFTFAAFLLWLVITIKAFQGETFKLPAIGDWAEFYSSPPFA